MVNFCAVIGCGNRGGRDKKSFYRLPSVITHQGDETKKLSERRQLEWLANINRADIKANNYPHIRVCSDHFKSGKPAKLYDTANPDWSPQVNMGHSSCEDKSETSKERYARSLKRKERKQDLEAAESLVALKKPCLQEVPIPFITETPNTKDGIICDMSIQTDLTCQDIQNTERELLHRNETIYTLREKVKSLECTEGSFCDDTKKVTYYTGLPNFMVLLAIFELVSPSIEVNARTKLAKFQQFILVMMRLRLNLGLQDLAYRFNISASTASRIFVQWINVMATKLKPFIRWPDRDELHKTMPMEFRKHFGNKVVVVIDCFEVFIERPSNLKARAQTWSNYKHHNTMKFLIGICPQGVITFISQAWGGRTSDKYLTDHCGFLSNLLPGDVVMADRGFDIQESVGLYCASVKIPAFTRGKKQLSAYDVEATRKLAHVRIHVERVIGLERQKYMILQDTLPIEYVSTKDENDLTLLDKVAIVACSLTNMCESVVPFD